MSQIIFAYNTAQAAPTAKNYYIDVYGLGDLSNQIAFQIYMTSGGDGTSLAVTANTPRVAAYTTSNCSGTPTNYNYSDTTLPANAVNGDFVTAAGQGSTTGILKVKVTLLSITIGGTTTSITTSPQTIVSGGNNYIITGYNVCGFV